MRRTEEEAKDIFHTGEQFLKLHLILSGMSFDEQRRTQGRKPPLQWGLRPKIHYFYHQLVTLLESRQNFRHHHTFVDEDAMRWLKLIARGAPAESFERHLLRLGRVRMRITYQRARKQNRESAKRSAR